MKNHKEYGMASREQCMLVKLPHEFNNIKKQDYRQTTHRSKQPSPKHCVQHQEIRTHGCAVHPVTHPSRRGREGGLNFM